MPNHDARAFGKPRGFWSQFSQLSSAILLTSTFIALIWSNVWPKGYLNTWDQGVGISAFTTTLREMVNEALMPIFFFLIGLELSKERQVGILSHPKKMLLPLLAACGGMITPAAVYRILTAGSALDQSGWAIPTATDIAFALAALNCVGRGLPKALKAFLLALAVLDDLGAIILIACLKKPACDAWFWCGGLSLLIGLYIAHRRKVESPFCYGLLGIGIWALLLRAGFHGTLAGVITGLFVPVTSAKSEVQAVGVTWYHQLEPWVNGLILPLFALANAGASIRPAAGSTAAFWCTPCFWGAFFGLLLGKPVGVSLACFMAVQLGLTQLPTGVHWRALIGVAALCGIGFTMALFLSSLSFEALPAQQQAANLGVMAGSLLSALLGNGLLRYWARAAEIGYPGGGGLLPPAG